MPGRTIEYKASPRKNTKARQPTRAAQPTKAKRRGGRGRSWLFILALLGLLMILAPFVIVQLIKTTNESRIFLSVEGTPARPVAVVFGAGLNRDGSPSPMLADRLNSSVALYKAGKVQRLFMTGDNTTSQEVTAMRNYAVRQGVPANDITGDQAGLRTYDSCYRAVHTYGLTSAVLVTQGYHLPRALYLCNSMGLNSVGLKAGRDNYPGQQSYNEREFMATFLSWIDITISQPKPEIETQPANRP